jgi:hypothetical protein
LHGGHEFRINKKDSFLTIPNLTPEAVRKHVATLGILDFVETVQIKEKRVFDPYAQRAESRDANDGQMDRGLWTVASRVLQVAAKLLTLVIAIGLQIAARR